MRWPCSPSGPGSRRSGRVQAVEVAQGQDLAVDRVEPLQRRPDHRAALGPREGRPGPGLGIDQVLGQGARGVVRPGHVAVGVASGPSASRTRSMSRSRTWRIDPGVEVPRSRAPGLPPRPARRKASWTTPSGSIRAASFGRPAGRSSPAAAGAAARRPGQDRLPRQGRTGSVPNRRHAQVLGLRRPHVPGLDYAENAMRSLTRNPRHQGLRVARAWAQENEWMHPKISGGERQFQGCPFVSAETASTAEKVQTRMALA